MTAGRGSGDLKIPVKGHHDVTKPNGNKGWTGPHRDFWQMALVRLGGHSLTVLRSGAKTTGEYEEWKSELQASLGKQCRFLEVFLFFNLEVFVFCLFIQGCLCGSVP